MRILVAEDEPLTRRFMVKMLAREGHRVAEAEDGAEAWDKFSREPFPLVLTDWMMPGMSGIDLCRSIRDARVTPYPYVVMITSLSLTEHTLEAFRAGTDDILGKPVDREVLFRRIEAIIRGLHGAAEGALQKCVSLCQAALGPEHAALLQALGELGALHREQRAYVRCRAFLRRQIGLAEKTLGPDDERTEKLRRELEELQGIEERL
jgi:DNA-binding response OmpR family regulator